MRQKVFTLATILLGGAMMTVNGPMLLGHSAWQLTAAGLVFLVGFLFSLYFHLAFVISPDVVVNVQKEKGQSLVYEALSLGFVTFIGTFTNLTGEKLAISSVLFVLWLVFAFLREREYSKIQ